MRRGKSDTREREREREKERNTERNTNINNKESEIRYLRRHVSERRSSADLFREECDLRTCCDDDMLNPGCIPGYTGTNTMVF